ncbi:MAG TPA: hypothetical protein VK438_15885 [Xanthobacteraceae bacterium]|nr:hypothetical protein [Xanthobacteraceae bacterium]
MTDLSGQIAKSRRGKRGASTGLVFALAALVVLVVAAAAFVALVLWPRWPAASVAPDAPALPITVGGVLFNVPPPAIRVAMQRRPGAQERLDLAFLWPSLAPPDPTARPAPSELLPPIDRLFITIEPQASALSPSDRVRTIYPRYLAETQYDGPDGLKVISFNDDSPYRGEDLFFDPTAQPGFVARCSRPGRAGTPGMCLYERRIEAADVTIRFPSDWLPSWRALSRGIDALLAKLRPSG